MRLSREERKKQLIEVSKKIFIKKGYHLTTTKEIAKQAGVSEPVIYKHFANKQELFFEVIKNVAFNSFKDIKLDSGLDLPEFLESFIYQHLNNVDENFELLKFFFLQVLEDDIVRNFYLTQLVPQIRKNLLPYLEKINQNNINQYSVPFNGFILGGMMIPFIVAEGLFNFNPENLTRKELSKRLVEVFLRAISVKENNDEKK